MMAIHQWNYGNIVESSLIALDMHVYKVLGRRSQKLILNVQPAREHFLVRACPSWQILPLLEQPQLVTSYNVMFYLYNYLSFYLWSNHNLSPATISSSI
jgi:hypothetical protein